MALNPTEREMAEQLCLSHHDVYARVYSFYKKFMENWSKMSDEERAHHYPTLKIDQKVVEVLTISLPTQSDDLFLLLNLSKEIVSGKLEFGYHLTDEEGIKLGQYAHYILSQYAMLNSFLAE